INPWLTARNARSNGGSCCRRSRSTRRSSRSTRRSRRSMTTTNSSRRLRHCPRPCRNGNRRRE
ncbi:MAG: hypothetical protein EOM76_04780, partial [Sphingobacteriia bacterium]|nr:hypothetical protein [Sphingobacteriia bacterium]